MNPSDDQPGHAPIYSKKKKTATRGRKKETKRPGGVSTLDEPKGDVSKEENSKNDTTVPSSYAISSHGGKTDLGKGLALQARSEGSAQETTGKDNSSGGQDDSTEQDHSTSRDGDAAASDRAPKPIQRESGEHKESVEKGEEGEKGEGGENSKGREQRTMKEYSAEARTYHAYYEELQRAHLREHHAWCRNGCLKLLGEPRIPLWTRIQTLQLLSTMLQPAGAKQCLKEADRVLDILKPDHYQTQLLRDDNRKMKADRELWRIRKDLVGKDIEGIDEAVDDGPSDAERLLNEKLRQELEAEMEPFPMPGVEMADVQVGKVAGLPSPASSET